MEPGVDGRWHKLIRIVSFHEYNEFKPLCDGEEIGHRENRVYAIQLFGLDEKGNTYSVKVRGFTPRFYCKVPDYWRKSDLNRFIEHIKEEIGQLLQR